MSEYETEADRRNLEAELDELPPERSTTGDVSTVVSVRLRGDELASLEQAARAAGIPVSTFIRQAALGASSALDVEPPVGPSGALPRPRYSEAQLAAHR